MEGRGKMLLLFGQTALCVSFAHFFIREPLATGVLRLGAVHVTGLPEMGS